MIDCRQPEVIIEFNGYFRLLCQHRSKCTDAVILFLPALPFRFNGFVPLLHFFITAGVAFIPLHVFCLVLHLDGIFLNTLTNQLPYDLHLFCQGSLLRVQFRAVTQSGLHQLDVLQNMLPTGHQLSECPEEQYLDVLFVQMWCGTIDYPRNIRAEDAKYQIGIWGEYKVPFTFATNGRPYLEQYKTKSGIWCLDLRLPSNAPKALHGWISPTGIMELLEKDIQSGNAALQALPYDLLRDKDGLNLRDYQIKAIEAAEKAIIDGKQTALIAMATGTGKTRTVLGMIYRFLTTNRFKRILFLVDRTSLGEQAHDVFREVKLEDLMTLDEIYNIKGLDDKAIDKETRIQVATVQGMVKRILYSEGDTIPLSWTCVSLQHAKRPACLEKGK